MRPAVTCFASISIACTGLLTAALWSLAASRPITVTVEADRPGARISPTMWGIFFEDINFGADGGLCAELVKNRSFEFPTRLMGWTIVEQDSRSGSIGISTVAPFIAANPHYLRMESTGGSGVPLKNSGFRGMGIREGEVYDFSAQARTFQGAPRLRIELVSATGQVLANATLDSKSTAWRKLSAQLKARATDGKAQLKITVEGEGTADLDMVSLFPRNTWKKRPNGLRADLVQMLADMKPAFLRFPGGCIVEGRTASSPVCRARSNQAPGMTSKLS